MGAMMRRSAGLPSLLLVGALALTGCGGSAEPEDDADAAPTASGTSSDTSSQAPTVSPELPVAPEITRPVGAVGDLEWDAASCGTGGGGEQTLEGSVRNSSRKATDYLVNISWISDGSDVLGRGITVVRDVKPGSSADFTLSATVLDGATRCVPNVLRGAVAGRG